ncbi:MAG TPA: oligogalacturonate lyase family protein [Verrucomicrobiae bacterium]|nr:oligogalacturonate lyase family protein [Verrucomicrobiae bacterium]
MHQEQVLIGLLSLLAACGLLQKAYAAELRDDWIDAATGHRVVRLSRVPGRSESLYFNQNAFTETGDKMVFVNSVPGTRYRVMVLDWTTRLIEPLTGPDASGVVVSREGRRVFYSRQGVLYATDLDTHATRRIGELPPRSSAPSVNADETLVAGTFTEGDAPLGRAGAKPARFDEVFEAKRPQWLYSLSIGAGKVNPFYRYAGWLNHVQFSPTDPGLLMFCHEGPWHKVDRIWLIRTDASGLRLMHARTMPMEIAGHEFWSWDGRSIWFDLQVPRGERFFIAGVELATGKETRYPLERDQWSVHYNMSQDGKFFAGDGGAPNMVAHARNGKWIWLFTPESNGTLRAEKLVNMSQHDYRLEPNVNFTPDGKWVVFRGNFDGSQQVYAVEVANSAANRSASTISKPTLFLIGDSTVHNRTRGQLGWGDVIGGEFDAAKISVTNCALGGRSSRTFLTEGLWDRVLAMVKPGDFVLMQFGHNDGGALDDAKGRASLKGAGDESLVITNRVSGKIETVHTYGWYLRKYITDTKAKEATPIVLSPVPRKIWRGDEVVRANRDYGKWAAEAAQAEEVPFVDLNNIVARHYEQLGQEKVNTLFGDEHTHTNPAGAELNAQGVIEGLKGLHDSPLARDLAPEKAH